MPRHQVGQPTKNRTTTANVFAGKQMATNYYWSDERITRDRRLHGNCGVRRAVYQGGTFCYLYLGNYCTRICQVVCQSCLPIPWVPGVVLSDWDTRFTSLMCLEVVKLLGTDMRYRTAFHPQTNGQSEVTITVLENFLDPYLERYSTEWSSHLSLVEFASNNATNASTSYTPFNLNSGTNPVIPLCLMSESLKVHNETVSEILDRRKQSLEHAR